MLNDISYPMRCLTPFLIVIPLLCLDFVIVIGQNNVPKHSPVKPKVPTGIILPIEESHSASIPPERAPKALIVTAHPDDETCFAATIYKITKELGGTVDLAVITNGEAGYKYSTLAEDIYHLKLTDEAIGRENLPAIRKRELMAGGKYIGIRNYYFFDQKDTHYTLDADTVLRMVWDVEWVKHRLRELAEREHYDIVFTLLPAPETHGHHKAATIIALEIVNQLISPAKPAVLGCGSGMKNDTIPIFNELAGYPITHCAVSSPIVSLDKTQKFGFNNRLNYTVITSWVVAEHKSQGTMHLGFRSELENFWLFGENNPQDLSYVKDLFRRMANTTP